MDYSLQEFVEEENNDRKSAKDIFSAIEKKYKNDKQNES